MLLADSAVWIDHYRSANTRLQTLLKAGMLVMHPYIVGEISLGASADRARKLTELRSLRKVRVASDNEVQTLIDCRKLYSRGIGYVDAHLLASCLLDAVPLWSLDKRLMAVAADLGVHP